MEENTKLIGTAIITLLISLGGFGGYTYMTQEQFENAYYCELTEQVGIFAGGLSGTGTRGYPNVDNRKGYKDCYDGSDRKPWIPLKEHAEKMGIDPMSFIINSNKQPSPSGSAISGVSYLCDLDGCTLKEAK